MELKDKLTLLERSMTKLEEIWQDMTDAGFHEQAKYADTLAKELDLTHYDLIEREGPVFQRRAKA